jgi:hypothetical protein
VYHFDTNDVGQWSEAQYNTLLYNNLHLHQLIGTVGALYRVAPGRSGDIHLRVRVLYEAGNAGVKRRARRHRDLTWLGAGDDAEVFCIHVVTRA